MTAGNSVLNDVLYESETNRIAKQSLALTMLYHHQVVSRDRSAKQQRRCHKKSGKSTGLVLNQLSIMTKLRRGFEGQVHLQPRTHLICRAVLPQNPAQSTCMGPSFDLSKAPLPQYIALDQQTTYYKHGDSNVKSGRWGWAADLLRQETHGVASLYLGFTIPPPAVKQGLLLSDRPLPSLPPCGEVKQGFLSGPPPSPPHSVEEQTVALQPGTHAQARTSGSFSS